MTVHHKQGGAATTCGVHKSRRWFSQLVTSNPNWSRVTCKRCLARRHDAVIASVLLAEQVSA